MDGISFPVIISQIRTTVDGGWKITFDVDASCAKEVLQLANYRQEIIQAAFVPDSVHIENARGM